MSSCTVDFCMCFSMIRNLVYEKNTCKELLLSYQDYFCILCQCTIENVIFALASWVMKDWEIKTSKSKKAEIITQPCLKLNQWQHFLSCKEIDVHMFSLIQSIFFLRNFCRIYRFLTFFQVFKKSLTNLKIYKFGQNFSKIFFSKKFWPNLHIFDNFSGIQELCDSFNLANREYFFDRSPRNFDAILGLYRTGKLHLSQGVSVLSDIINFSQVLYKEILTLNLERDSQNQNVEII